jgi:hypothetical protein
MENKKFFLAFFSLIGVLFLLIMIKSSKKNDKLYQAQLKKEIMNTSLNSTNVNQSFNNNDSQNVEKENLTPINSSQNLETVNNSLQESTLDSSKVFTNNSIIVSNNDSAMITNVIKENITTIDVLLSNSSMNEYYEKNKDYNQRISRKRNYENDYPSDKRIDQQTKEVIKKDNLTDSLTVKVEKIIDLENHSRQIKDIKNQAKQIIENKLSSVSSELDNLKNNLQNEEEKDYFDKQIKVEMDKLNNSLKEAEKNIDKFTIESYYNNAEKNGLIVSEESKNEALNKTKDEEFFHNIMNKLKGLNLTEEEENKLNKLFHNKQEMHSNQSNNNNLKFMQTVNEIMNETTNFFNEVERNTSMKINQLNKNIINTSETKNLDEKINLSNETISEISNSTNTTIANATEQIDSYLTKDIKDINPETNQSEKLNTTNKITNISGYSVNNNSVTGELKPNIGFIGVLGKFLQLLIIVGFVAALIFLTLSYFNIKQKKIHRRKKFDDVNEESLNTEITYNLLI